LRLHWKLKSLSGQPFSTCGCCSLTFSGHATIQPQRPLTNSRCVI
jgi:hypothetical protein